VTEELKNRRVRASRDGDQFHYLWAARRCLHLISPAGDLIAVAIEGASTFESPNGQALEKGDEVIDVAEYYGSEELTNAAKIRYTQLKHSTHRATEPWTFSGLHNAVTGFAEKFKEIKARADGTLILGKIEFVFATNRSISAAVTTTAAELAQGKGASDAAVQKSFENATGLKGSDLERDEFGRNRWGIPESAAF
jgi:hypothetical protein